MLPTKRCIKLFVEFYLIGKIAEVGCWLIYHVCSVKPFGCGQYIWLVKFGFATLACWRFHQFFCPVVLPVRDDINFKTGLKILVLNFLNRERQFCQVRWKRFVTKKISALLSFKSCKWSFKVKFLNLKPGSWQYNILKNPNQIIEYKLVAF